MLKTKAILTAHSTTFPNSSICLGHNEVGSIGEEVLIAIGQGSSSIAVGRAFSFAHC